jgi:16S rRNA (uracil1498-N3)-methyltransferase
LRWTRPKTRGGGALRSGRGDLHAVLVPAGLLRGPGIVPLEEEERHHLRVRRGEEGERVLALDGAGTIAEGRLVRQGKDFAVRLEDVSREPRPPVFVLVVGAGDRDRFAWLVEKAAELGVSDLVPLVTERTRSVAAGIRPTHVAALQRRARQAIKQSRAPWSPVIHPPRSIDEVVSDASSSAHRWLGDLNGNPPPAVSPDGAVTVVVGPEGGLTDPERERFLGAGFTAVRLAPDLLRFETAALAAAAVVASQRPRSGP